MSKGVRAVVIGLVVGFAVTFALSLVDRANGESLTLSTLFVGGFAGLFTAYILGNLSGNRSVANASEAQRKQALAAEPPPGKMLLYVQRQGFVAKLAGLNISVDGRVVAQLKSPRFTMITLPARAFSLSAKFGGLAGPQSQGGELVVEPPPGGIAVVKASADIGLIQGKIALTLQPDPVAGRTALPPVPMPPAEVPKI
jgi:hypothetical protein